MGHCSAGSASGLGGGGAIRVIIPASNTTGGVRTFFVRRRRLRDMDKRTEGNDESLLEEDADELENDSLIFTQMHTLYIISYA